MNSVGHLRSLYPTRAIWLPMGIAMSACLGTSYTTPDPSALSCAELLGSHPSDHTWGLNDTAFFWVACRPRQPDASEFSQCDDIEFFMVLAHNLEDALYSNSCWTIGDFHDEADLCLSVEDYHNVTGWVTCD